MDHTREQLLVAEIEWLRERLSEPEATLAAIRNGEVDAFVITERLGEKVYTLKSADPPYRLMVEGMKDGAATVTADGIILYANRRLGELLGASVHVLRGNTLRTFLASEQSDAFARLLQPESEGRGEVVLRRIDGSTFPAHVAVSTFEDDGMTAFSLVITDVTEQSLQAALAASEETWKEANRRKDEFLATLAHELRGPLGAIGNAVDILNHLGPVDTRLQWARDLISRQVLHLARIVDDLLDVSRIATGKVTISREAVDLNALVRNVVESHRPLCDTQQRRLSVSVPPQPVGVDGDPTRLAQIVANLLQNAIKFTRENGSISVSLEERDGVATIAVRDDGVGISPEMLERVFELFVQSGDRRQLESGLGIGLTLVRRLVELHGGTVRARSDGPDRGSEFIVALPAVPTGTASARAARPPMFPVSRRILIVEDHRDTAEGLAMLLRMQGHDVVTVADGPSALEACGERPPDVVLLDIGLPGMDGYEAGRRLRELLGPAVLIVALTGFGQDEDRRRSAEAGIDVHLLKPVRGEMLYEALSRHASER